MTEQQMKEALEKALEKFAEIKRAYMPGTRVHELADEALSEISAILNPPRYVVLPGRDDEVWYVVDAEDMRAGECYAETRDKAHADRIARLLSQEEERDGD